MRRRLAAEVAGASHAGMAKTQRRASDQPTGGSERQRGSSASGSPRRGPGPRPRPPTACGPELAPAAAAGEPIGSPLGNAAPRLVLTPKRSIGHGGHPPGEADGIPTDAEVEELARRVIENFPPGAAQVLAGYGIDPPDGTPAHPVANRCR